MKRFIIQTSLFIGLVLLFPLVGIMLPETPRQKYDILQGKRLKDKLLQTIESPRIITVSGSSMTCSLISHLLEENTGISVINYGLTAEQGVEYMIKSAIYYAREGDIIVVAPEYDQYFGDFSLGGSGNLRLLINFAPSEYKLYSFEQYKKILPKIFKYSYSKFKLKHYKNINKYGPYSASSYNRYGDLTKHLDLQPHLEIELKKFTEKVNLRVLEKLKFYEKLAKKKGATILYSFPPFWRESYYNNEEIINHIYDLHRRYGITTISKPLDYIAEKEDTFDQSYHLSRSGAIKRTLMLSRDINTYLEQNTNE